MLPIKVYTAILFCFWCTCLIGQVPTYYDNVRPILERHCVGCHQQGQVGAMPLTTYEEVTAYGKMIGYVTEQKLMPPWYADPGYNHMANERLLSVSDMNTLRDWLEAQMPAGTENASLSFPDRTLYDHPDWKPDLIVPMEEAFEQFGIYLDQYQVFVLPVPLAEGRWIDGIAFIPGNPKIVRYASVSIASSMAFDSLDQWDPRYGYYRFGGLGFPPDEPYWYTWSPLQQPAFLPKNTAKYLPAHSRLIVAIHYGPTGKPQKDSSRIEFHFSANAPTLRHITAPLINPHSIEEDSFYIPAGAKKIVHGTFDVPFDIEITDLTPQANLLCKSWEVWAKIPGQPEAVKILKLRDWNFNWKTTYHLREPLLLPKGSRLHARALYDNTLDNPCNPAEVPVGFKTGSNLFNELFYVHFGYTTRSSDKPAIILSAPSVVSMPSLSFEINVQKPGEFVFQMIELRTGEILNRLENHYKKGSHTVGLSGLTLKAGNYLLRATDKSGNILAQQLLFRIEKGEM